MKRESLKYIIGVLKGEEGNIRPEWYETLGFLYSHKIAGLFYKGRKGREYRYRIK